jgi:hypothetical protein
VAIDLSPSGGTTIGKIAAWAFGIGAFERLIRAMVPLFMIVTEIAFLRHCRIRPEHRKR